MLVGIDQAWQDKTALGSDALELETRALEV
jgi:hypothetical protein